MRYGEEGEKNPTFLTSGKWGAKGCSRMQVTYETPDSGGGDGSGAMDLNPVLTVVENRDQIHCEPIAVQERRGERPDGGIYLK